MHDQDAPHPMRQELPAEVDRLKATRLPLGLLINFNATVLLRGVKRVARAR